MTPIRTTLISSLALAAALAAPVFADTAPAAAAPAPPAAGPAAAPAAAEPVSPEAVSYSMGLTFGEQLRRVGVGNTIKVDEIVRGLKEGLAGKSSAPADQQHIQAFVRAAREAQGNANKAAAKDFLAKNGKEPGVVTTASGLEYKIVSPGDEKAPSPQPTDEVTVNYSGRLIDGTEFDSSYKRGEPATFQVRGVIKGWQEALALMKPGAKWQVFIPPELAYDMHPPGGVIPPGAVLVFDVELLSVKPAAAAPAPGAAPKPAVKKPAAKKPADSKPAAEAKKP